MQHNTDKKSDTQAESERLDQLAKSSDTVLFRCKSLFPFDFFPDAVVVTQSKVDIIYGHFFFVKSVHTLLIENILTMRLDTGPLFASLQFEVKGYEQNPPEVGYLAKHEAVKAQEIIMGLVAAKHEGIDLKSVQRRKVTESVNQIGATKGDVTGM